MSYKHDCIILGMASIVLAIITLIEPVSATTHLISGLIMFSVAGFVKGE